MSEVKYTVAPSEALLKDVGVGWVFLDPPQEVMVDYYFFREYTQLN